LTELAGQGRTRPGVVLDRRAGSAVAVLSIGAGSFALLDEAQRASRVAAWSAVLATCAQEAGAIHRLQWVERTVPAAGFPAGVARPSAVASPIAADASVAARASYEALLRSERGGLVHELLLVVAVRLPGARSRREPGALPSPAAERLKAELGAFEQRCRDSGLTVQGALSGPALGAALRRACLAQPATAGEAASPWPASLQVTWSAVRTDALWHSTYWISEWPRHDVPSDFLVPLLLQGSDRRTLSLTMAPLAPGRAVRSAEHARTSQAADAELRARHGFALTARSHGEREAVLRRESELAEGHAGYRFSGYLTVSAPDPEELARARRRLEQTAALARLELRRLDGLQDQAFTWTLPLGRGCR
ncbi:MAG: PrgI family protein, partial [Acidimicrobiaceae bacterium]|nr:PrgI family protein [Acidimicrobiaceae bacterium]